MALLFSNPYLIGEINRRSISYSILNLEMLRRAVKLDTYTTFLHVARRMLRKK